MCPAHTLLFQNPVLALHRAANMPKISYVYIWIIHCRARCRKASKFSSSYLPSAFILRSELYVFNAFSSKLFTQISLRIKTGVYIQFLIHWLKLHTKMSAWLWLEAGKLCCMKSHHWEKTLTPFILLADTSLSLSTETKPPLTRSSFCWFPAGFSMVPGSGEGWITVQRTKSSVFSALCEAPSQVLKAIFRSSLP